jgi:NADH-quinone oxidoreductase subunit N
MQIFSPIFWTFIFSIVLVIFDAFTKKESRINIIVAVLALFFIIYSGFANITAAIFGCATCSPLPAEIGTFTSGMLNFSKLSTVFDIIYCIAALLVIIFSKEYLSKVYNDYKEYYSLIFFSVFGMMCISHSNNLVVLFLGIETMSISFYALTGLLRNRISAVEGSLKYFLLGSFASGFLLYGIAMIYGATETMYYQDIAASILNMNAVPLFLKLGIGLLLVGFLFKVAVFPFHQWAPDVYQASASPISGLMSTAGKIAALSGFIGIVLAIMPTDTLQPSILSLNASIQLIIAIAAAATMLIGNITALSQKNIKRMLAYSSVGHAGYMLMGIIANTNEGITSIVFYSLAYTFTQIGAFIVVSILERKDEAYQLLSDYAGLSKRYPFISACMAIFMFSLAGMPPFAGFFGKYFLFKAAIDAGFTWLTIIAVITSLISVYFYLSVIVQMYFKENESNIELEKHNFSNLALVITLLGVIFIGLLPLIDFSKYLF